MVIEQADRFLADCVRAAISGQPAQPWPDAFCTPAHFETLSLRASFHGIALFLGQTPAVLAHWPEPVVDKLRHEMRLAGLWEELHHKKITALIASLAEAGIETIALKGTALAYLFYDEPATRRRGDTDLLIRPGDVALTRTLLEQAGCFRRQDPHGLYYQETWLVDCGANMVHSIDLHWQPSDRPVLQKILGSEHFWRSRVPVPRLSPHARAPDAIVMLVHGAVNQLWHQARGYDVGDVRIAGGRRLIWAVDYHQLTKGFSDSQWEALVTFCDEHGAGPIVGEALRGAQHDIGLAVPDGVMRRLGDASRASAARRYIATPGVLRDFWRDFLAADRLEVRLRLLSSLAFAPRSHLIRKYPDCSHWPTALLQLRRYAGAVVRWRKPEGTG